MEFPKLSAIEELLIKAGSSILEVYESDHFGETTKSDLSPVTRADQISSSVINAGLAAIHPGIPVIDEENSIPSYEERKQWTRFFMLDPLDGTREFIKQNGEFCINLAYLENNFPVCSWIYSPVSRSGWYAIKGRGIFSFGHIEPLEPSPESQKPCDPVILIASRSHPSPRGQQILRKIKENFNIEMVRLGSALKQVEIALGRADVYIHGSGCSEWDTAAGHLMVEEYGGIVEQWDLSGPLKYNKPQMKNPPFMMFSKRCQNSEFVEFIKNFLHSGT